MFEPSDSDEAVVCVSCSLVVEGIVVDGVVVDDTVVDTAAEEAVVLLCAFVDELPELVVIEELPLCAVSLALPAEVLPFEPAVLLDPVEPPGAGESFGASEAHASAVMSVNVVVFK